MALIPVSTASVNKGSLPTIIYDLKGYLKENGADASVVENLLGKLDRPGPEMDKFIAYMLANHVDILLMVGGG